MAERPEDLNLPNAVINKIIKEALPDNVNISKDARLAISKAASVFVLYSTSCANNFAMQHKRKTITGQDVLDAMKEMEFERFVEPLKRSLEAYKEQRSRKDVTEKGGGGKQDSSADGNVTAEDSAVMEDEGPDDQDGADQESVEETEAAA
jgi:DNA polymerase epsilon subunit 3